MQRIVVPMLVLAALESSLSLNKNIIRGRDRDMMWLHDANNNNPETLCRHPYHDSSHIRKSIVSTITCLSVFTSGALLVRSDSTNSPAVTHKVFLDIKIANYTEESIGTNKGAIGSGRLIIGLYGKDAPESVKIFLSTLDGNGVDHPNYVRNQFSRIVDGQLLEIEKVRGINRINIAGQDALEYQGALLSDNTPILETNTLRHDMSVHNIIIDSYSQINILIIITHAYLWFVRMLKLHNTTIGEDC